MGNAPHPQALLCHPREELGQNLRNIQVMLGHESSSTTEVYTHVMGVNSRRMRNPLDMQMGRTTPGR